MSTEPELPDPMPREEVLRILGRPAESYRGAPYLRIIRTDGSAVVGRRTELENTGSESVVLDNVDFRYNSNAEIPIDEIAGMFDFGVQFPPPGPRELIGWAGTRLLGYVLDRLPIDLGSYHLLATPGGFAQGKPVFDRDVDIYADLDWFRDNNGNLNQLGITVLAGGLTLGWNSSLAKAAHDRIEQTSKPYFGICQEPEGVLKGYLNIFIDPATGLPASEVMGGVTWLQGRVHDDSAGQPGHGSWVPVKLREDLIRNYSLGSFLRIDQELYVYGQIQRYDDLMTSVGASKCLMQIRLIAYLDPGAERPGRLVRTLRRIFR